MSAARRCFRKSANCRNITSPEPRSIFWIDSRADIASQLGPNIELIGLGTGAGTKTRILFEALANPAVYIPVDISEKQLRKSTALFRKIFPNLEILPVCADYLQAVTLPSPRHKAARNVVYFPGSTIGNFEPEEAVEFLCRIANVSGRGGGLLIGVDLKKDQHVIEAAYNDNAGVTAEFNLNLLRASIANWAQISI